MRNSFTLARAAFVALLLGVVAPAGAANAQQACASDGTRARFDSLFAPMIGDWEVTIRDFDEHGQASPETRQIRRFARAVGNRYVEEKAFTQSADGALTNIGIMLYSFDDSLSQVRLVSFWPRSPQRWADLVGCVDVAPLKIAGTITSHRPNEPVRVRRVEIVLESSTRARWRGFERAAGGREYVAEELSYVRISR